MHSLVFVVGTRPEIIKIAPVIIEAEKRKLSYTLIHTGQHYDKEMSDQFFDVLNIKKPEVNLEIKYTHSYHQLGEMIKKLGEIFHEIKPQIVLAVGDTYSVLAACLASVNTQIPFGHIESGLRSYDNTMPEETNRKMIDSVSSLLFAPSQKAVVNLYHEGIDPERIYFVGNTVIDSLKIFGEKKQNIESKTASKILENIEGDFAICTLHRISNVENKNKLKEIIETLESIKEITVIFLLHPRTAKKLKEFNLISRFENIDNIVISSSVDYITMLQLMLNVKCKLILTDSGGLQEEAAYLKIPCITLRSNTERPETIEHKINKLVRIEKQVILDAIEQSLSIESYESNFENFGKPYGDGHSSKQILDTVEKNWENLSLKLQSFILVGLNPFS